MKANGLSASASPYLRKAARQPVNWLPYGEGAFEIAARENKPVFLSSGAAWCHWCHVQASESFKDPEVAGFMNENFVCIKVDMDERPDVDRRYQEALHAMGLAGGWPLSIFLTPEGKPFYGGTYFPPRDSGGIPGFMKVLKQVAEFYKQNKDKANEHGAKVMEFIRPEPLNAPLPGPEFLGHALGAVLAGYDAEEGGFGDHPKFPAPGAMLFLAGRAFAGYEMAGTALKKTLSAMASGGIHDQLGGGFHRYSTDRYWIIPHFEKLAEMNAWFLRSYCEGFAIFGEETFAEAARGICAYASRSLADPAGGFYSSQDADSAPGEEGLYYSWSIDELKTALAGQELELAVKIFIHPNGEVPGQPGRYVLFQAKSLDALAGETGIEKPELKKTILQIQKKLLSEREKRQAPFVDTTIYSSVNGAFISAYLFAWRVLGGQQLKDFALKSLDRVLGLHFKDGRRLMRTEGVEGQLDDYVHMMGAMLDAFECTGKKEYLEGAESFARELVDNFWDSSSYGFFDTRQEIAGLRLKRFEDVPGPSANPMAAWHLIRMHLIAEGSGSAKKTGWLECGQKCIEAFTEGARKLGMHAGSYFAALDGFYNYLSVHIDDAPGGRLARAALNTYRPYLVTGYGAGRGQAVACIKNRCMEPLSDPDKLTELIRNFRNS